MTPKQFKPIILRTLKAGQKFQTVEAFADHLIAKMDDFADMFAMALEVAGTTTSPAIESVSRQELPPADPAIILPTARDAADVSERFKPKQPTVGFLENFTKEEMFEHYSKNLPATLQVHPLGCKAPITLARSIQRGPGESFADMRNGGIYMPTVKISYAQPGVSDPAECVSVVVSTSDADMNPKRVLDEITAQANARYTSERRKIEPKFAIPPPQSLDETIRGTQEERTPWNTTDEQASGNDLSQWGAPVAGVAASKFNK